MIFIKNPNKGGIPIKLNITAIITNIFKEVLIVIASKNCQFKWVMKLSKIIREIA